MSELNGGHLVARTLKQAGVGHVFTLCGGHILPIYDGCITEGVQVVDMRHEQACAHAADAYARLTRNVGVALVTAGPVVTDAVTGIANAYSARSPVLLIGGAAPLGLRGLGSLQEVEQVDLLRPITKGSWTVSETRQIPEVLTTAIRHALTGRPGPVFVEIPVDLLLTVVEDRMAPIPTAYEHPQAFAQARGFALGQADVALVLGTPLDFRLGYGRPPSFAENVQVAMVDCDPVELGRNRPLAMGLASHIGLTLRVLADALPRALAPRFEPWQAAVRKKEADAQARLMAERRSEDVPISHYRLAHEIAAVVDAETTVVGDGGDVVGCASKIVPLSRPGQWLDPGPFGCLGVGPSFAIATKLLRPEQHVLLITSDEAFGLNKIELETTMRFKLPMTIVVGNDNSWEQIRNPQLSFFETERSMATSLPFTRYDR